MNFLVDEALTYIQVLTALGGTKSQSHLNTVWGYLSLGGLSTRSFRGALSQPDQFRVLFILLGILTPLLISIGAR